jgi:hypothetical protein
MAPKMHAGTLASPTLVPGPGSAPSSAVASFCVTSAHASIVAVDPLVAAAVAAGPPGPVPADAAPWPGFAPADVDAAPPHAASIPPRSNSPAADRARSPW